MKRPTVTIGIPAYNEEQNIKKLLLSLLKQKAVNYKLEKILVVSDASTDSTNKKVRSMKNKMIKLIVNRVRLGKNATLNLIAKKTKSDILVLFDADVLPKDNKCLSWLIVPFLADEKVGITSGKMHAVRSLDKPIGRIIANSYEMKRRCFEMHNGGNNIYLCIGRLAALSKRLYSKISWPVDAPEDAFSYLFAKKNGFDFVYAPKSLCLFQPVTTILDHAKQSNRFKRGIEALKKYFNSEYLDKEYSLSVTTLLIALITYSIKRPYSIPLYVLITLYVRMFMNEKIINQNRFDTAYSSKYLDINQY